MFAFGPLLNLQVRTIVLQIPAVDVPSVKAQGVCLKKLQHDVYKVLNPTSFALGALVAWFAPHNFRLKKVGPCVRIEKL